MRFGLAVHLVATSAGYPIDASLAVEILSYACIPYLLYRQLKKRRVKMRFRWSAVLAGLGALDLAFYAREHPISGRDVLLLIASMAILAIGLGVVRAHTVRLWEEGVVLFRQGTMLTAALWLAAVGLHLTVDHIADTGSASLLLYLGLTTAAQRIIILRRAGKMRECAPQPTVSQR